jgi:uncharacterized protein (UPF0303 family)
MDLRAYEAEATELVFPRFEHDDAWAIGVDLRARALAERLPVAIDIRTTAGAVLFHASLPGATADQEDWIRRKAAVVFRFSASSALVAARLEAMGRNWLDPNEYAPTGGGVAVAVEGAGVVAAVIVSGLSSEDDHAFAADALRRRIGQQCADRETSQR